MQSGDLDSVLKKNLGNYRLMHSHFCYSYYLKLLLVMIDAYIGLKQKNPPLPPNPLF